MATRKTHSRKVYIGPNGETQRSAFAEWVELRFEFLAPEKDENDNAVVIGSMSFPRSEVPESIAACAIGHGLSQKLGDALAGIDKKADELGLPYSDKNGYKDAMEAILDGVWSDLLAGDWITASETGAGTSNTILIEAIAAAYESAGKPLDEDGMAKVRAKVQDKESAKAFKANAAIAAEFARITAERAAARAAKAKEAAADATPDLPDLL